MRCASERSTMRHVYPAWETSHMALQVVATGWGRTGTMSLKLALERLGFPCPHMHEVFLHPEQVQMWIEAARGNPDWETIFDGYRATCDWPSAAFWRELTSY